MCTSVKDLEDAKSYLSDIQKRLSAIEKEIENGCERDYGKIDRKLDKIEEEVEYIEEQIFTFERNNGDWVQPEEKVKYLYLRDKVVGKIEELRNEISGDSNREIMQMMYPDEDIDSEEFEDGFDIED